ncbi:MAG: hypothetical protein GXP62_04200 [Oligoflexia bacterium]|nr:hypothetical protein [Oligoflexia bacterium]
MYTLLRGAVAAVPTPRLFSLPLILLLLWSAPASAYPFMIEHSYTGCGECHTDPSGGGVLTNYGRGQGVILLSSVYKKRDGEFEPGKSKDFLFGAIPLPKQLALQADIRAMLIPQPGKVRLLGMQNDLEAGLDAGPVRGQASIGWVSEGGQRAWLTRNAGAGGNLVSRVHWLGIEPAKDLLIRAGRMNLPFGIRSEQHMLMARSFTGTDTNKGQEYGLDVFVDRGKVRAEVMGIAGDLQVSPDAYRQRGYSAMVGWGITHKLELGLSSKITHAALDEATRTPATKQAHEVFGRWSPASSLALLSEVGLTASDASGSNALGTVGYLQADFEPAQGFHVVGTGEWCDDNLSDTATTTTRGWLGLQWFAVAHFDVRADAMYGTLYCTPGVPSTFLGMIQAHAYL